MRLMGVDASMSNVGLCFGQLVEDRIEIEKIYLISTEKDKSKKIRVSSDVIRRCREINTALDFYVETHAPQIIFAETPSGSQNHSSAVSYGITCALLSKFTGLIEVTPIEIKKTILNKNSGSKREMINWASNLFPHLQWFPGKKHKLADKNEHMADAIGSVFAGIQTEEFKRIKQFI